MYIRISAYDVLGAMHVTAAEVIHSVDSPVEVRVLGTALVPLDGIDAGDALDGLALLGECLIDMAYGRASTVFSG